MASKRLSDRKLSLWTFVIFTIAFHKYTHEGWRVLLESIGFRHGVFGADDWLGNFRTASERAIIDWLSMNLIWEDNEHVFNRLIQNQTQGIFSAGISLNLEGSYQSQIGLGSWLLTLPATFLGLTGTAARFLTYSLVTVVNASIATVIVTRVRRALSLGAALVVMLFMLQPMVLVFASSPLLIIGLRLLPALWIVRALRRHDHSLRSHVVIPLAMMILIYATGYGWITLVPTLSLLPTAYFAVRDRWTSSQTLRIGTYSLIASIGGFAVTLGLHVLQLSLRYRSIDEGINRITAALVKRTGSGTEGIADPLVIEAVAASPRLFLDWYLAMPIVLAPARVAVLGNLTVLVLIAVCFFITAHDFLSCTDSPETRHRRALGVAWITSLFGPLSWLLLFRPSAYIHTHIDGSIWYFPTIPLGALLMWTKLSGSFAPFNPTRKTYLMIVTIFAVSVGALYLISWTLMTGSA